jgi:hypothetical protein
MHKLIERLLEGKDPEEAVAMLKEILVDYFGFGSSIELEELALILGQIANDYNQEEADLEEEEEQQEDRSAADLDEIKKAIEDLQKKINPPPVNPFPPNPMPYVPKKRTPGPYEVDPYKRPWVGDPPGWYGDKKYTMRTAVDNMKKSGLEVTPELFQNYVSSLASHQQ